MATIIDQNSDLILLRTEAKVCDLMEGVSEVICVAQRQSTSAWLGMQHRKQVEDDLHGAAHNSKLTIKIISHVPCSADAMTVRVPSADSLIQQGAPLFVSDANNLLPPKTAGSSAYIRIKYVVVLNVFECRAYA